MLAAFLSAWMGNVCLRSTTLSACVQAHKACCVHEHLDSVCVLTSPQLHSRPKHACI